MRYIYLHVLSDEELRPLLEHGDSVSLLGMGREWERIEHQVERLGFGTAYAVSRTRKAGTPENVRIGPVHWQQAA